MLEVVLWTHYFIKGMGVLPTILANAYESPLSMGSIVDTIVGAYLLRLDGMLLHPLGCLVICHMRLAALHLTLSLSSVFALALRMGWSGVGGAELPWHV